ncbi:cell wall protein AWA1 isoform X2 [Tetranychus urticae]|uniref:cell wall protein AWA1 isoform X2 n=1 Tax=Tetranychus urticae TaxID=32264 RepID=UPI00077BB9AF|nr:cell wall protein AWA1 isoform X2 [Tetranychus urticae]
MPIAKHEGVKEEKLSANTSNSQGNEKDNQKETTTTTNKPQQGTSKSSDSDKTQPHPSSTEVHNTSRICSATSEASGKCEGGGGGGEGDAIEEDKRTKETSEITTSNNKRKETEAASKFSQPSSSSNQQTASCSSNTSSTQQTSHYHHQQQHQHLSLQQSHQESSSSSSSPSSSATPASSSSNNGRSNCTKLFCGSGSGSSDSKRKDVDENNMNGSSSGNCDTGSKWRKSSRKGSKKKEKYALKEMIHDPHHTGFTQVTGDGVSGESGDIQQHCFNSASVENGGTNATSNQQSQQSGAHDRKSCCFCWCCCCSCSCLPVKNQGKTGKENSRIQPSSSLEHYFNGNGEQPPSLEEIRLWAESFDKLMKCPWGRKVFRDFLKCEYSEENILFWLACEDLKNESNPEVIEEKARIIYEDYISILSPKEVSLDSRVREIINKNMVNPSPRTFDEAQLQIYTLMHRDSYPRFINSPMYRKLAQLPSPSRKGSTA